MYIDRFVYKAVVWNAVSSFISIDDYVGLFVPQGGLHRPTNPLHWSLNSRSMAHIPYIPLHTPYKALYTFSLILNFTRKGAY